VTRAVILSHAPPGAGINWADRISWAVGFAVGILNRIPGVPADLIKFDRPAALCSFVATFIVYYGLPMAGLLPPAVPLEKPAEELVAH
jgi:cytosine/uracil/thiamine/allantoin permease